MGEKNEENEWRREGNREEPLGMKEQESYSIVNFYVMNQVFAVTGSEDIRWKCWDF